MQYTFERIEENYPKRKWRSKRLLKKLHLQEFGVMRANIVIDVSIFNSQYCDELIDAMYEYDDGIFVFDGTDLTNVLVDIPVADYSIEYMWNYCYDLLAVLYKIDVNLKKIKKITVKYGDAYYGEW